MLKLIEGDIRINQNRYGLRRRIVCFLLSFMLHTLSLYLIFHSRITYKIYPDKWDVREVFIVSPEEIFVPENIEEVIRSSPFIEEFSDLRSKKRDRFSFKQQLQEEPEAFAEEMAVPERGKEEKAYPAESLEIEQETRVEESASDLTSTFKLNLPLKAVSGLPEDYKLDLSRSPEKLKISRKESEEGIARKDIDLLKYIRSDYSDIRPSGARSKSGSYRPDSRVRRGRTYFYAAGYDISPWAEKVVNKIQTNWIIPSPEVRSKGLVGISVTVEKNGELSSIQMVSSSSVQQLDEAALRAVRMSSPFPSLPDDFPKNNLETYLEFVYDD